MRISVDQDMCAANGLCAGIAPQLFELDEDGFAVVQGDGDVPTDVAEQADDAVDSCPAQAIILQR